MQQQGRSASHRIRWSFGQLRLEAVEEGKDLGSYILQVTPADASQWAALIAVVLFLSFPSSRCCYSRTLWIYYDRWGLA